MISSAFSFNDYIKMAYSDDESCGNWVMLISAIIFNVGSIVITSFCCVWFLGADTPAQLIEGMQKSSYSNSDSCGDNLAFIIITFVFIVISLILGLARLRDDATIFTSGLVNFWLSFLLWSGLAG